MATLTVSVSNAAKAWVDDRIRSGEYASSDEYLAELIERDRVLAKEGDDEMDEWRRIVDEAEASGISRRTTDEIFSEAVERAKASGFDRE